MMSDEQTKACKLNTRSVLAGGGGRLKTKTKSLEGQRIQRFIFLNLQSKSINVNTVPLENNDSRQKCCGRDLVVRKLYITLES